MSNLYQLQQIFLNELFIKPKNILSEIKPHPHISQESQFNLYKNSIITRFQKTLSNIYPVCLKLVGDDFFRQMCYEFILVTPSSFKDLNCYGENFFEFISTYQYASSLPYLSDVAKLECANHRLFSVGESKPFDFAKLAEHNASHPESIIFELPIGSTLIASPYPIVKIWQANQDNFSGEDKIVLHEETVYFFIWRSQHGIEMETITEIEFHILSWIQQKILFAELCHKISSHYPTLTFSSLLSEWIAKGWIVDTTIKI